MNSDDSPFASRRESPGLPASPIDQAIDRAVRKMMQVDPPAGLRRRVMARIEAGPSTRGFMSSLRTGPSTRGFMGSPGFAVAAALAIVVLGVVATRYNRVAPAPVDAPAATVAVPEKTPETTSRVEPPPQPVAAPPARPRMTARTPGGFRREPIPMAPRGRHLRHADGGDCGSGRSDRRRGLDRPHCSRCRGQHRRAGAARRAPGRCPTDRNAANRDRAADHAAGRGTAPHCAARPAQVAR